MKKILLILFTLSSITIASKNIDNEELTLMYDSFIYSKELSNAYKIAKQGVKAFPNDISWHKRLSDVALWSGKINEALNHMLYIYKHTNDPKLASKLIKQMLGAYQYQKALPIINKEFKNNRQPSNRLIDIYEKVGNPQQAIKILKKRFIKNPDPKILAQILPLQIELGDIKGAKDSVSIVEKYPISSSPSAALAISKYYFLKKELKKAYKALLKAKKNATTKDIPYLERVSDFANYMGDKENMLYASLMLFQSGKYRVVDLDRINKEADKNQIELRKQISKEALKKFHRKNIFINSIKKLLEDKKYKEVKNQIEEILKDKNLSKLLKDDPKLWIIKASVDEYLGDINEANRDLFTAQKYSNRDPNIEKTLLWHLINHHQYKLLKDTIKDIETRGDIDPILYHPLSAGYFTLQKSDKALFYFHKAFKENPKDISLQLLYSEILGSLGKDSEKKEILSIILENLQKRAKENPNLLKDQKFLRQYIQASIPFISFEDANRLLNKYKRDLDKQDFWELKVILALKQKDSNMALYAYKHLPKKDRFLALDIANQKGDIRAKKEILKSLGIIAPNMLKIQLLEDENKIHQAIKLAKYAIKENRQSIALQNKLAYLQKEYANCFKIKTKYQKIGKLKHKDTILENFYYLAKGYGLITKAELMQFYNIQKKATSNFDSKQTKLTLGLRKHIKNGKIETAIEYIQKRKKHFGGKISINKSINEKLSILGEVSTNVKIDNDIDNSIINANKDSIALYANYQLNSINQLDFMIEKIRYKNDNSYKLADAIKTNFTWNYLLNDNHDIRLLATYRMGKYKSNHLLKGNLPINYQDIGMGISYGQEYQGYGKTARPYFNTSIFYDTKHHKLASDVYAGVASSFTKDDYYNLSAFYQNSINGQNYENYGVKFNYNHLYGE